MIYYVIVPDEFDNRVPGEMYMILLGNILFRKTSIEEAIHLKMTLPASKLIEADDALDRQFQNHKNMLDLMQAQKMSLKIFEDIIHDNAWSLSSNLDVDILEDLAEG